MDIPYLINLLQNKFNYLNNARSAAAAVGDLNSVTNIDQEILTTQNTISQLQLLESAAKAATTTNSSVASLLNSAIASAQAQQGPSASAIVNGYDISAYATDALYEQKITNILAFMPAFTNAADLSNYIQGIAPGAPVTGDMIFAAASRYSVNIPLMVAIMQLDSAFGTKGVGANTNNPGNIGNTGTSTQSFASWDEGVNAVAEWLSRHRISDQQTDQPDTNPKQEDTEESEDIPDEESDTPDTTSETSNDDGTSTSTDTGTATSTDSGGGNATSSGEQIIPAASSTEIEAVDNRESTSTVSVKKSKNRSRA